MTNRFVGVEGARGIAALLVVLYHATRILSGAPDGDAVPLGGVFAKGGTGVDIFFVISGFVIAYAHRGDIGRPARLGPYAWRRFSRIFPAYWVALALFGALLVVSPSPDHAERDPSLWLTSILLLPHPAHEPILGVAWTLQFELLFYVLIGVLILNRAAGLALLAVWSGAIATLAATGAPLGFPAGFVFSPFGSEFLAGVALAAIQSRRPETRHAGLWLVSGGALLGCLWALVPVGPALHLGVAFATAVALRGVIGLERRGFAVPVPLIGLGTASYSIYLLHVPTILVVAFALRIVRPVVAVPQLIAFILAVTVALAATLLFHRMVEAPLLAACRHLGRRQAPSDLIQTAPGRVAPP